jgi:Icc protein
LNDPITGARAPLTLLQITDVHLRAEPGVTLLGVDTWDSVNAVLDQALAEAQPDAVIVTGDLAHDPLAEVYERFATMLARRYAGPVMVLPGNHDVLAQMAGLVVVRRLELPGWTLVALDSHVDDEPGALVDRNEFEGLKQACREAESDNLLIATHHPPIEIDCPWLDKDRIKNGAELLEWMSEHGTIRAMVFGHAHQEIDSKHRHIHLLGTPSTCLQFAPRTQHFAVDERKPGYRWLYLGVDGTVSSEVRRVADYALSIDRSQFKE